MFFSFLWSPLVKVDLSHPKTFVFVAGAAPAAPRLTCLDLVIEGAGEQKWSLDAKRTEREQAVAMARAEELKNNERNAVGENG